MKPVRLSCGCGLYNDITLSFVEIDVGYRAAVFQFCLCKWQWLKMTGIVIFIFFVFMNIISSWEFWEMYSGLR